MDENGNFFAPKSGTYKIRKWGTEKIGKVFSWGWGGVEGEEIPYKRKIDPPTFLNIHLKWNLYITVGILSGQNFYIINIIEK